MIRKFMVNVNGNSYEVEVEEVENGFEQSPSTPTRDSAKQVAGSIEKEVIQAPMPGTILRIEVKEGQDVKSGDNLLILESMKMENELVAPRDGRVVSIVTSVGASVDTGDKLVVIE